MEKSFSRNKIKRRNTCYDMNNKEKHMSTRVKEAEERKKNGYNCTQAVACAYCDLTGIDEEKAGIITIFLTIK